MVDASRVQVTHYFRLPTACPKPKAHADYGYFSDHIAVRFEYYEVVRYVQRSVVIISSDVEILTRIHIRLRVTILYTVVYFHGENVEKRLIYECPIHVGLQMFPRVHF